jgi:hypothetical protein
MLSWVLCSSKVLFIDLCLNTSRQLALSRMVYYLVTTVLKTLTNTYRSLNLTTKLEVIQHPEITTLNDLL